MTQRKTLTGEEQRGRTTRKNRGRVGEKRGEERTWLSSLGRRRVNGKMNKQVRRYALEPYLVRIVRLTR